MRSAYSLRHAIAERSSQQLRVGHLAQFVLHVRAGRRPRRPLPLAAIRRSISAVSASPSSSLHSRIRPTIQRDGGRPSRPFQCARTIRSPRPTNPLALASSSWPAISASSRPQARKTRHCGERPPACEGAFECRVPTIYQPSRPQFTAAAASSRARRSWISVTSIART